MTDILRLARKETGEKMGKAIDDVTIREQDTNKWTNSIKRMVSKLLALAITLRRENNAARLCLLGRNGPVGRDIELPLLWKNLKKKDEETRNVIRVDHKREGVRNLREILEGERFAKVFKVPDSEENIISRTVVRLAKEGTHARVTTRCTPDYVLDPSKDRNIRGKTFQFLINIPHTQRTERINVTSFEIDAYFKGKKPIHKNDYVDLTRRLMSERVELLQDGSLRLDRTISSFDITLPVVDESSRNEQQKHQENHDEEESDMFDVERLMFRDTKEADVLAKLGRTTKTTTTTTTKLLEAEDENEKKRNSRETRQLRMTISQIGFTLHSRARFVTITTKNEENGLISTPRDAEDGHNLEVEFPDVLGLELTRDFFKTNRSEERDASLYEAAKTMVLEKSEGGWLKLSF